MARPAKRRRHQGRLPYLPPACRQCARVKPDPRARASKGAGCRGVRSVLVVLLLRPLVGVVAADEAADAGADQAMVTHKMTGDAADGRTLQTSRGFGRPGH